MTTVRIWGNVFGVTRRRRPTGISPMVYIHVYIVIHQAAAEIIAHVYACACVRVRAIPAQVHVLLTISNCTTAEGYRPRKTFPSAVPLLSSVDLSSKQRGGKIARIFLLLLLLRATDWGGVNNWRQLTD